MARTVHCEGGDLDTQGSSRLLVLVKRHQEDPSEELAHDWVGNNRADAPIDSGDAALTPPRQHAAKPAVTEPSPDDGTAGWVRAGDVIGLHADASRRVRSRFRPLITSLPLPDSRQLVFVIDSKPTNMLSEALWRAPLSVRHEDSEKLTQP